MTNEVPQSVLDQIPGINALPPSLRGWVVIAVVLSPFIGRAIYSLKNGGGVKGFFSAIWIGTNTPKQP